MSNEWHIDSGRCCRRCQPLIVDGNCFFTAHLLWHFQFEVIDFPFGFTRCRAQIGRNFHNWSYRMPFMKGRAPIRRTINYLNYGKLVLKNEIKVFCINYNLNGAHHAGAKEFTFWYLPQIQYKNPNVQIVTLKNLTPSPFIRCFYGEYFIHCICWSVESN